MRKFLVALAVAALASPALAQIVVGTNPTKAVHINAADIMPPAKFPIAPASIPKARAGTNRGVVHELCTDNVTNGAGVACRYGLGATTTNPGQTAADGFDGGVQQRPYYGASPGGQYREGCGFSHIGYDDPIVFPGRPGQSHPHSFFGNQLTGLHGVFDPTKGNSTCAGGTLNRTGYWVPAMVDTYPTTLNPKVGGNIVMPSVNGVYYKTGAGDRGAPTAAIALGVVWPKANLRMIAGSASSNAVLDGGLAHWICFPNGPQQQYIPTTAEAQALGPSGCNEIVLQLYFPNCWDGVNVDSVDHQAHMSGNNSDGSCPSDHPVMIPRISYNIHWPVTDQTRLDYWELSSDQPIATMSGPCAAGNKLHCRGATTHGDWWNGWDQTTVNFIPGSNTNGRSLTDALLDLCLRPRTAINGQPANVTTAVAGDGADCHENLIPRGVNLNSPTTSYILDFF